MVLPPEAYMDQYGLMQPSPSPTGAGYTAPTSDNGTLFTTEYLIALNNVRPISNDELAQWINVYRKCEIEPGLYRRSPGHYDQEQIDNLTAIITFSCLFDYGNIAKKMLEYGKHHFYFYNTVSRYNNILSEENRRSPYSLESFMYRFPQLICHMKWAAKEWAWPWEYAYWLIVMAHTALTAKKNEHDRWILSFLMLICHENRSFLTKQVCKLWRKRFALHFPGGMAECMEGYFNNPEHPTVMLMKGRM